MVVEAQRQFHPLPLEDIPYFMLDEHTKCYIGTLDDTCRHLEANGLQDYFLLAIEKKEVKDGNTTKVWRNPQIFQVSQTICYRSIAPVSVKDLPYEDKVSSANFTLPRIPLQMLYAVEDFLRGVAQKHGTEAIVLLTFNEDARDDDGNLLNNGWGFLIPDQENTSSHCDYKPDSIVGEKPDNVVIVGSIHSHPDMPAFASGTDHNDQAGFNGLHITFGWQKSVNNGETQYHIELQIEDRTWSLRPDQVFEDREPRQANPDVEGWIEAKVKKKSWQNNHGYSGTAGTNTRGITDQMHSTTGSTGTSSAYKSGSAVRRSLRLEDIKGLPAGAPSHEDNTIVGRLISAEEINCPFCRQPLISQDRIKRRCTACHSYLALPGESIEDVLNARQQENVMVWDLDVSEAPPKPIILWDREDSDNSFVTVYEVEPAGK